jgi:hypothetical protein
MPTRYVEEVVYKWLCDRCSQTFATEVQCVLHERHEHASERVGIAQSAFAIQEVSEDSADDADEGTLDESDTPQAQLVDEKITHRPLVVGRPRRFIIPPKRYQLSRAKSAVQSKIAVDATTSPATDSDLRSSRENRHTTTTGVCKITKPKVELLDDESKSIAPSPRPFECKLCKKAFKQYAHLWQHNKIVHENSRRFQCDMCDKCFHLNEGLTRHRRLHTNEKPFECPDCGERFSQMGHARRHAATHTGVRPHTCPVCSKKFTRLSDVRRHMLCVHKYADDYVLHE